MIPKVGTGFRKRSCSSMNLERDDESKRSHPALDRAALASFYIASSAFTRSSARRHVTRSSTLPRTRRIAVLVDVRTYRVRPGKLPQELELYAKHGLTAQIRHLGTPLAYLLAESGDLNTMVHLWTFEDAADRTRRRAAMMLDPEWLNYLKLADEAEYLVEQRNSLMVPASFAPIKR